MHRAKTPYMPNIIGLGMAAPTLLQYGQEELKKHLLPRLFSGEDIWCQGFSEPGSGSDLASVQTFAKRDGDALSFTLNPTRLQLGGQPCCQNFAFIGGLANKRATIIGKTRLFTQLAAPMLSAALACIKPQHMPCYAVKRHMICHHPIGIIGH